MCYILHIAILSCLYDNYIYLSCLDARPPPMDPSDSAVEFSQTHFSRDDDLISLQIEPHRYGVIPDC